MGSSASKANRQESPEQRRQRYIKQYGVLIPPVFVVSTGTNDASTSSRTNDRISPQQDTAPGAFLHHHTTSLSAYDRVPLSPSLVDSLTATYFGRGLLQDFMTPGMWILAGGTDATRTATTTVRASLPMTTTTTTDTTTRDLPGTGGQVSLVSSPTSQSSRIELCARTDGPLHLFLTHRLFQNGVIFANTNSSSSGYVGAQVGWLFDRSEKSSDAVSDTVLGESSTESQQSSDHLIHVQLGSWIPLEWNRPGVRQSGPPKESMTPHYRSSQPPSQPGFRDAWLPPWIRSPRYVHGYLAMDMLGSTTAIETQWNTDTYETVVSKYFSVRLDGPVASNSTSADLTDNDHGSTSPPLWLTMTSNAQSSTTIINISQLLSFDRINLNPLDTRAPRVRNTLGWTVQVEKPTTSATANEGWISPPRVSVAAAWQYNRGLAFKLVGTSSSSCETEGSGNDNHRDYSCTLGILLKRWRVPRVTCSILGRYDFQKQSYSFVGVGLELETDASTLLGQMEGSTDSFFYTPPGAQVSDTGTPETKASLG